MCNQISYFDSLNLNTVPRKKRPGGFLRNLFAYAKSTAVKLTFFNLTPFSLSYEKERPKEGIPRT
jgi:hypothetical protein